MNGLGNIELNEENKYAIFSINPKIYGLQVVYCASYIMIDKAFIILDGDPEEEILVEIRKKEDNQDLTKLVQEFNEELLNYSVYWSQSEKNKQIREIILQKILLTNNPPSLNEKEIEKFEIDDEEKIMEVWDESKKPENCN